MPTHWEVDFIAGLLTLDVKELWSLTSENLVLDHAVILYIIF